MKSKAQLKLFAEQIRVETLKEFAALGFGHVGGAMSVVETIAVLYGGEMKIDPARPEWPDRDWLIMSKGHAGPTLYATLAMLGYFPKDMLLTLNKGGTNLPSHCDRLKTPGIDMTTGSLGQGMSTAIGVAMGNRLDKRDNYTYLIIGDGECNEGQIWEGAMSAAHHKLDRLITFVDFNRQQLDGFTKNVLDMGDIGAKFAAFGWDVHTVNGHDTGEIGDAIAAAKKTPGLPHMIVLNTVKGHGCTFAEGVEANHHINFTADQMKEALEKAESVLREAEAAVGGAN